MYTHEAKTNPSEHTAPASTGSNEAFRGLVAVAGGTGFVGRHLIAELLSRGCRVRTTARDLPKAHAVLGEHDHLEIIEADILGDATAREAWAKDADAAANLIGIIRETGGTQTFDRAHRAAARSIVRTLEDSGVHRYLHMSALGVRSGGVCEYQRSKWDAEQTVRKSDLDWTIFRPGMIHGPDGEFMQMVRDWAQGKAAPWFFLPYFLRPVKPRFDDGKPVPTVVESPVVEPVYVGDVAATFADVLSTPTSIQEVYQLVGPERLNWPELLTAISEALPLTRHLKPVGIPGHAAAAAAVKAKFLGMGDLLPFDYGMAMMGMEDSVAETIKARAQLGYSPRPFRPLLQDYASTL